MLQMFTLSPKIPNLPVIHLTLVMHFQHITYIKIYVQEEKYIKLSNEV